MTRQTEEREGYWTKKARFRVGRITKAEHEIHVLQARIDALKMDLESERQALKVELTEMERHGEPPQHWANHWRVIELDMRHHH
jgi:predicted  nucleic acid-binding Zn-ribbon protein